MLKPCRVLRQGDEKLKSLFIVYGFTLLVSTWLSVNPVLNSILILSVGL